MSKKENFVKTIPRRLSLIKSFILSGFKVAASEPYFHHNVISLTLFLAFILNAITWIYLLMHRTGGEYPIILHYNLFFGVDQVGDFDRIFVLPEIGLIFLIVNAALGNFFYRIERIASYLLTLNAVLLEALLLIASYLIIKVNA